MSTWQDEYQATAMDEHPTVGALPTEVSPAQLAVHNMLVHWPATLMWRPGSSCIELSRYVHHALTAHGIPAKVVATDLWCGNQQALDALAAGCGADEWPAAYPNAYAVGVQCESCVPVDHLNSREPYRRRGFGGHVVVIDPDHQWLVDVSAAQFSRPRYGWTLTPLMLGPLHQTDDGWTVSQDLGKVIVAYYLRPKFASWRQTPAWQAPLVPALAIAAANAVTA